MNEFEISKILDSYITLPEVFRFYGYEVNRNGFACCPFHMEKTPSCRVNTYQFHCFGCDARGNAISFVEKLFNLPFKDAVAKIDFDFGLHLLDKERQLTKQQQALIRKRQVDIYERKQKEIDLENQKQAYFDAWKKVIIFEPLDKPYDINTPQVLVDEFFHSVDKRYWQGVNELNMMTADADIGNYIIDRDEAKMMFTK